MKTIKSRLAVSAGLIFILVSITAFFLAFGTRLNNHYLSSEQIVEERVDALEHLTVSVYRYFKRAGDVMVSDGPVRGIDLDKQRADVMRDLEQLDAAYAGSPPYPFAASAGMLERNREIRSVLETGDRLYRETPATTHEARHELKRALDERIESEFLRLVQAGIDDEQSRLDALRQEYRENSLVVLTVSTTLGIVVAAISFAILYLLYASIKRPLARLGAGTRAISEGNYDDRVAVDGPAEYAELAESFNEMAEKLRTQTDDLIASRAFLEREVERQTLELQQKNIQLQQLDESRKRLLLDVGHELRTPLTVVQGEVDIALRQKNADRETLLGALERIAEVTSGINRLVVDLFTIARADFEPSTFSMRPVDYRDLLAELYDSVVVLAARKSIDVTFELPYQSIPGVADPDRVKQAITAVFDNAVRYSHRGGSLLIEHSTTPTRIKIKVTDEGIGVETSEIQRVFDRFYRSDAAKQHSAQGSGLGLSVAGKIIEQHDGSIELAPNPAGAGTIVEIILPLNPPLRGETETD